MLGIFTYVKGSRFPKKIMAMLFKGSAIAVSEYSCTVKDAFVVGGG